MRFVAWFCIVTGVGMLLQWGISLAGGQVPELNSEPRRIAFHLAGEGLTAVLLIISGAGLLRNKSWAKSISLVALGMLLYTVIVSPGYFAQLGQWPMVVVFAVLLILTVLSIRTLIQSST